MRGLIDKIRRSFPGFPATRAHLYVRLIVALYVFILFLTLAFISPIKKGANIGSILLQFGSAALLWWESTTVLEHIDLVSDELELQGEKGRPNTRSERILEYFGKAFATLVFFLPIIMVALQIFILFPPGQTRNLVKAELVWLFISAVLYAATRYIGKTTQKSLEKYASRIQSAKGRLERRQVTKQAMRSIAFAIFSIGLLIQTALAWID